MRSRLRTKRKRPINSITNVRHEWRLAAMAFPRREKSESVVCDGGNDGTGGNADGKPFCGALEAHKKCSAMHNSDGGVSFVKESRGACFFVRQVFFKRVVLNITGATVLQIVEERYEIGLRDGNRR